MSDSQVDLWEALPFHDEDTYYVECGSCARKVEIFIHHDSKGWLCVNCIPHEYSCGNHNWLCSYRRDCYEKNKKHKMFFCKIQMKCIVCFQGILEGTIFNHYAAIHANVTYENNTKWPLKQGTQYCLISCVTGVAMVRYKIHQYHLQVCVYLPVWGDVLNRFRCAIELTDTKSDYFKHIEPIFQRRHYYDFQAWIRKNKANLMHCELSVNIACVTDPHF